MVKVSLDNGTTWQSASVTGTTFSLSGVTLTGSDTLIARVEDIAGNFSAELTQAYVLDQVTPSVTVNIADGSLNDDDSSSDVTFTFSEAPDGTFDSGDISFSGGTLGSLTQDFADHLARDVHDLAWFNAASGNLDLWKLDNGRWAGSVDTGSHPVGWQPVGTGDFTGDGMGDVAWYNSATGAIDLWQLNDGRWAGSIDVGAHPAGWRPVASDDFNGDGATDIAWYNAATGNLDIWMLANGRWSASVDVGSHPAGWQPIGAGDFNGDGTSDIAWFNPMTNNLDIWMLADGRWSASVDVGAHPAGWTPAVGDFNGDGTSDILWVNAGSNAVEVWELATATGLRALISVNVRRDRASVRSGISTRMAPATSCGTTR